MSTFKSSRQRKAVMSRLTQARSSREAKANFKHADELYAKDNKEELKKLNRMFEIKEENKNKLLKKFNQMVNKRQIKIIEDAYMNDFVDSIDYKEKELDNLAKEGYLTNKHKTPKGVYIYWISEKGLEILKKLNKTFN